ncbi:MAG: phosphatidylserine decarboxylase [Bacteroidales bacterium]|nr:phosphatidylserine decarboxylase [Candidatus Cacconaster merdequi]
MKLDRNSYGTVILVYALSAIALFILFRYVRIWWIDWPLLVGILWVCRWQTLFHMVPDRERNGSDSAVSSVSDGKVVFIGKAVEKEWLKKECTLISVYMDFWDYHANFWPVTGEVTYSMYHPGKHFLAFKPKASEENEHTCVSIRTASGQDVFFKQLAGGFARRIVCYAKKGLKVVAGAQCGIIKFGSRIDIYLPLTSEVKVAVGDILHAQESVIALLK